MYLKGETLIETIIASVILTLSLLLAMGIVNKVVFGKSIKNSVKIQEVLQQNLNNAIDKKLFDSNVSLFEEFSLKQTVENSGSNLKIIKLEVFKNDSVLISSAKQIIYTGNEIKSIYNN